MIIDIPTRTIRTARFKFWLPPNVHNVRGLVVLVPGSNGDGLDLADDEPWQEWAAKNRLGLIGCFFMDKDPCGIEGYCKAHEESGEALLWAIREFSNTIKRPAIERVPLFLWGFSAGGQFNYEMNAAFPERVGAFVVNKGGIYYTALCSPMARKTPGLFFVGAKDDQWRQDVVRGLVQVNQRGGAQWKLVVENCAHQPGESEEKGMKFFEGVLMALEH